MPLIKTNDATELFFTDWGDGKPVVFSHGWVVGSEMWEHQLTHLARHGLRCVAYDRRGCGRSSQPWNGYDADTFAADLAALLEGLDLSDVTLVAHSMAGGEVARYLSTHGAERVGRVVLVATTLPYMLASADNPHGVPQEIFDEMIAGLRHDRPQYLAPSAPTFFGADGPESPVSPELLAWGVGLALRAAPHAATEMVRVMAESDYRSDMDAFTVPTLILHGTGDPSAPIDLCGRSAAEAIPGSRLVVYDTPSHGLPLTHAASLNRDLVEFIET